MGYSQMPSVYAHMLMCDMEGMWRCDLHLFSCLFYQACLHDLAVASMWLDSRSIGLSYYVHCHSKGPSFLVTPLLEQGVMLLQVCPTWLSS